MTPRGLAAASLACVLALMAVAGESRAQNLVGDLVAAATPQAFGPNDLLFMEVLTDGHQLAETMNVYSSRAGVYLPLGEFSRVLDFGIGVFPGQFRAEGQLGAPDKKLVIDLRSRSAMVEGRTVQFSAGQAVIFDNEIYVRADLIEQLLPVRLKADANAQTLTVTPTRPLPFQEKLAREQRAAELSARGGAPAKVTVLTVPYALFTPPAIDINLGGQITRDGTDQSHSYDLRLAGDLAYASFEGYAGSDSQGRLRNVRVQLTRKNPDNQALGPLGGTRVGIGDVFTPSMPLGPGGVSGRGAYYSSAPLETLDLSSPLNLRGELPLGEEVELYVNEVLLASQSSPDQGRYEFLNVPVIFGLNTIRLVFYGPQGQRREQIKRLNFGAGQLEAGKVVLRLGAVQQNTPVFSMGMPAAGLSAGDPRLVAMIDYGLSSNLTLTAGLSRFTPEGMSQRSMALAGLSTSIGGVAAQLDLARDSLGGSGASLAFAARPRGISIIGRHAEYSGWFIDESRPYGFNPAAPPVRATDLRADSQIKIGHLSVPLSFNTRRVQLADDSVQLTSEFRTSIPLGRFYLSTNIAHQDDKTPVAHTHSWTGGVEASTLVAQWIQVRSGIAYQLGRGDLLQSAYGTVAVQLTEASSFQIGAMRTFGPTATTTIQASQLYSASKFNAALTGSYEPDRRDWRLGVQVGVGLGYDPQSRRYRLTRPGASAGGAVSVSAFIDANGDGRRQPGEQGVSKVVVSTPAGAAVTDGHGRVFATGLGDGSRTRMRVDLEGVDDPYISGNMDVIEIVPRPGRTVQVSLPMTVTSEVELKVKLRRAAAADRALAAVNLQLAPAGGGPVLTVRSDHAGAAIIEGVKPGRYSVQLDPDQAKALGMRLAGPIEFVASPRGGFVRGGDVAVIIDDQRSAP